MTLVEHWQETIFFSSIIFALWLYLSHRLKLIEIRIESVELMLLGPGADAIIEEALEP